MVGEGGNSQRNEGRCLAMLLVSLVRFMELKDFKGVLWNRPSRYNKAKSECTTRVG